MLAATGVVQTVRLTGSPARLLDGDHGRYLVVKLVALAAMLALANANRRRLGRQIRAAPEHQRDDVSPLRRTVLAEFAIGVAIIAITALMVVSPPASGGTETTAPQSSSTAVNYTM